MLFRNKIIKLMMKQKRKKWRIRKWNINYSQLSNNQNWKWTDMNWNCRTYRQECKGMTLFNKKKNLTVYKNN
jgi:hypothetical protein